MREQTPADTIGQQPQQDCSVYDSFYKTFQNGYNVLNTSSDNLQCTLFAVVLSCRYQFPSDSPVPTIDELRTVTQSTQYRDLMRETNDLNNSYFGLD